MNCKICRQPIRDTLLIYNNMPSVAQNLPDEKKLQFDKGVDLRICQCEFCGTIQLDNDPVPYYREVIRATGLSDEMRQFRKAQFSDFVTSFNLRNKKIIEIGCGNGDNLRILEDCGVKAYGLEYAEESIQSAKLAGLNVYRGFVDSSIYKVCDIFFDGFFTFSYLEHLLDPLETLRGVYNNLGDEAYGIVEVPNTDMFLEKGIFFEFMLDHLFYFTKDTLNTVLQLSGYDILSCDLVWHNYIISATVRKKKILDLSYMEKLRNDISAQIDGYINGYEPRKVAVWGASHQAFFIMAMLKGVHKLKYVVDSAEFKQGRYTPVSHIHIVTPDKINDDPVEAIIVMAGSYSDEVVRHIKMRFNEGIHISVLRNNGLEVVRGAL